MTLLHVSQAAVLQWSSRTRDRALSLVLMVLLGGDRWASEPVGGAHFLSLLSAAKGSNGSWTGGVEKPCSRTNHAVMILEVAQRRAPTGAWHRLCARAGGVWQATLLLGVLWTPRSRPRGETHGDRDSELLQRAVGLVLSEQAQVI